MAISIGAKCSSLSDHTKLVLGNRCLKLEYFVFGLVPLICAKKRFITKQMQRGGGGRTGLRKVKTQITIVRGSPKRVTLMKFKGLLRYHKPHLTD